MNNLYQLREERNLSQEEIAQFLGVTRQAYSRYEREERELNYKSLVKLSKFFDVSIDYILGNTTYYFPDLIKQSSTSDNELTSEERELLSLFRELSPYLKGMTLDAVRSWAKKGTDGERKKV